MRADSRFSRLWVALLAVSGACHGTDDERASHQDAATDAAHDAPSASDDGDVAADAASEAEQDPDPPDGEPSDAEAPPDSADGTTPPTLQVRKYEFSFDLRNARATSRLSLDLAGGAGCARLANRVALDQLVIAPEGAATLTAGDAGLELCASSDAPPSLTLSTTQTVVEQAQPTTRVGFARQRDRHDAPFAYLFGWFESCDLFGPCDAAPGRLAHYVFEVQHEQGDVVLCPGQRDAGAERTRCELLGTRAPSYAAFAIAANASWRATRLVELPEVELTLFEVPGGDLAGALDVGALRAYLIWLQQLLGPLPYGRELRVGTGPLAFLGMEHPGNILVRDDLTQFPASGYANLPLHALLHEIGHQWAGLRTTPASTLDFAWKEAIAEYLAYVFEVEQRPPEEAEATLRHWHIAGLGAPYPVRPLVRPALALEDWTFGAYASGPMLLFVQLEAWLGRPLVLAAVQRFLALEGARDMADLQVALEGVSGRDLGTYFERWIYGEGEVTRPELSVTLEQSGSEVTVQLTQSHPAGTLFPALVEVELRGATQQARAVFDYGLEPSTPTLTKRVAFAEPVTSARIDPERHTLFWPGVIAPFSAEARALRFHP